MVDKNTEPTETKEATEDWEAFVKDEVTSALAKFLPYSTDGKLGIVYKKAVKENTEAGPIYSDKLAEGVEIIISLDFLKAIDKTI